jgi:hypothetical protein
MNEKHPDAKTDCKICDGDGWLDDSSMLMVCLVPCICTFEGAEIRELYSMGSVD